MKAHQQFSYHLLVLTAAKLQMLCAALLFVLTLAGGIKAQSYSLISKAEAVTGDRFRFSQQTPRGVKVLSVKAVDGKTLRAIDAGLADLFAIAAKYGYRRKTSYQNFTVFIAKPDRTKASDGSYSPDIAVNAGQYAGSIYDKGGFIYAAGMVLSLNDCAFVIAESPKDTSRIRNIVRYEGEHIILYHNDRKLYNETADHSRGGGHPILQ